MSISKTKKDTGKYKVYSFGIHESTIIKLRKIKEESGKSWNRFFYELIQLYVERRRYMSFY